MKVPLRWLRDYVDFEDTVEDLAQKLTMTGFEVEAIDTFSNLSNDVIVGRILSIEPHPNAEKLFCCKVEDGTSVRLVVCGAPNVIQGAYVALAVEGAVLPKGQVARAKIRGIESSGMLCSKKELGISEDHSGIWILDGNPGLGKPVADAMDYKDWVFEFSITPNRPDCLSVMGIAREVAAIYRTKLHRPVLIFENRGGEIDRWMTVTINAPDYCPRYCGLLVRDVEIQPSPSWMTKRLEAAGIRAINNVVDITNFILLECGQPLHAFDYHFLQGQKIIVRKAAEGEYISTLDEIQRKLTSDDLLICDGEKPVAVAGVMGGLNSLISEKTKDVFIESAYFTPSAIRRTSRRLGVASESSRRFERGVDPDGVPWALHRAGKLISELAKGKVSSGFIDEYPNKILRKSPKIRVSRINSVLGVSLSDSEIFNLLNSIEITAEPSSQKGEFVVSVPSFRVDLEREVDLIEEVARLYGYDNIKPHLPIGGFHESAGWSLRKVSNDIRQILVGAGYSEIIGLSMTDPKALDKVRKEKGVYVRLANPISEELSVLRDTLKVNLLESVARNTARGNKDVAFFELRRIFKPNPRYDSENISMPLESHNIGIIVSGRRFPSMWNQPSDPVDFFDLKAAVEELLKGLQSKDIEYVPISGDKIFPYVPGMAADVVIGGIIVGSFGKIIPDVEEAFEINQSVFLAELELEKILTAGKKPVIYSKISKFPSVHRDLALLVPAGVPAVRIIDAIIEDGGEHIQEVWPFDLYSGKGIPEDKISLAFRLRIGTLDRSLTDAEADQIVQNILKALEIKLGIVLRQ